MKKIYFILTLIAAFATQSVFADDMEANTGGKACTHIANACLKSGYDKGQSATKGMWKDCMKLIILGKKVKDVDISANEAKACRVQKIIDTKMELEELQNAG